MAALRLDLGDCRLEVKSPWMVLGGWSRDEMLHPGERSASSSESTGEMRIVVTSNERLVQTRRQENG